MLYFETFPEVGVLFLTESRGEGVTHRSEECYIVSFGDWDRYSSSIVAESLKSKASLQPGQQVLDDGVRALSGRRGMA